MFIRTFLSMIEQVRLATVGRWFGVEVARPISVQDFACTVQPTFVLFATVFVLGPVCFVLLLQFFSVWRG